MYSEECASGREVITRDFTVGRGSRGLEMALGGLGEGGCCLFSLKGVECEAGWWGAPRWGAPS